jgi:GGDEF domain-containing protein
VDVIRRRAPMLVRDVGAEEALAAAGTPVRSLVAAPLRREGRVIGTLAFYDKVAADSFYPTSFHDEDFQVFTQFATYVERAVAQAAFHTQARLHRSFDEETGLPNAAYLDRRLDEEIARAGGREAAFALAVCRIENWSALAARSDPVHLCRLVRRAADALRASLRGFDVPARTAEAEFAVLLPDPGRDPAESVSALARRLADALAADDAFGDRPELAVGWAVHPADGRVREHLLEAAREPRIRTV